MTPVQSRCPGQARTGRTIPLAVYVLMWLGVPAALPPVMAAAIGDLDQTARIGVAATLATYEGKDPAGPVDTQTDLEIANVILSDRLRGSYRYWVQAVYHRFAFDAAAGGATVGADVTRYGLQGSLQRRLNTQWRVNSWVGAGLRLGKNRYERRHRVDADGFLAAVLPDRQETEAALVAEWVSEWPVAPRWDIAGKAQYTLPLTDGITEISASLVFLYYF